MSKVPFRTRVKFCGLTRPADLRLAGELGADAVGFVFAAASPRRVSPGQASTMRDALAPLVGAVALFMDNDATEVREVVRQVRPTLLQFHGNEEDAFCRGFGVPYIKAVAMADAAAAGAGEAGSGLCERFPAAAGFLFDSHAPGGAGGSGRRFDWALMPRDVGKPVLLAGGLDPDNIFDAILATKPWGVDVSSGIEDAPGCKDAARMRRFVEEVRRADRQLGMSV